MQTSGWWSMGAALTLRWAASHQACGKSVFWDRGAEAWGSAVSCTHPSITTPWPHAQMQTSHPTAAAAAAVKCRRLELWESSGVLPMPLFLATRLTSLVLYNGGQQAMIGGLSLLSRLEHLALLDAFDLLSPQLVSHELAGLTNLRALDLACLSPNLGTWVLADAGPPMWHILADGVAQLTGLTELRLSNRCLEQLPPQLLALPALQVSQGFTLALRLRLTTLLGAAISGAVRCWQGEGLSDPLHATLCAGPASGGQPAPHPASASALRSVRAPAADAGCQGCAAQQQGSASAHAGADPPVPQ